MPRSPMSSRHGWSGRAWSSDRVRRSHSCVYKGRREGAMRLLGLALLSVFSLGLATGSAWAQGKEPILLRDMGSFHVGGRVIEITGRPIKEDRFPPGGGPAEDAPDGQAQAGV